MKRPKKAEEPLTKDEILKAHIDVAWGVASKMLAQKEAIQLMAAVSNRLTGEVLLIGPGLSKTILPVVIRKAVKLIKADMALILTEAWSARGDLDTVVKKAEAAGGITAEAFPDRTEVIVVEWKTADGEQGHQTKRLMRDKPIPYVGEGVKRDNVGATFSRFLDGLFNTNTTFH